jgi:hypothetical protein
MLNTQRGVNFNANDVINSNDLRKRIINIDSRFRTNPSAPTTDFKYALQSTYKNVIRIKVGSVEIPNMFYVFSKAKSNISFRIKTLDIAGISRLVTITIPEGHYTSEDLITAIQTELDTKLRDPYGIFITVTGDITTVKTTLTHNGLAAFPVTSPTTVPTASAQPFAVDFVSNPAYKTRVADFGLGYNLGYRNTFYIVNKPDDPAAVIKTYSLVSEGCVDVVGDTYMFLSVNDFHSVEQKTDDTFIQCLAKIIIREDKQAVLYDDGASLLSNEIILPSPIDINMLKIQLLDAYGHVIDLCNMNFSISLEITEVLNVKLYDFYRNYIWMGTFPPLNR